MCVVSMVADHFNDKWKSYPFYPQSPAPLYPQPLAPEVSRFEFEQLRKEVQEMVALLKRAKIYDERNNEPNCEIEEKMEILRKIAKMVGVDLDKELKPKE